VGREGVKVARASPVTVTALDIFGFHIPFRLGGQLASEYSFDVVRI